MKNDSNNTHVKCVYRHVALPVPVFDYLKNFQRAYEERHRVRITNNQALTLILSDHQQSNAGA